MIKEAQESDEMALTPVKSGVEHEAKNNDLRKKFNDAKRRGNRSGVNYSPLLKEQMILKGKDQANSVIVIRKPVKL